MSWLFLAVFDNTLCNFIAISTVYALHSILLFAGIILLHAFFLPWFFSLYQSSRHFFNLLISLTTHISVLLCNVIVFTLFHAISLSSFHTSAHLFWCKNNLTLLPTFHSGFIFSFTVPFTLILSFLSFSSISPLDIYFWHCQKYGLSTFKILVYLTNSLILFLPI